MLDVPKKDVRELHTWEVETQPSGDGGQMRAKRGRFNSMFMNWTTKVKIPKFVFTPAWIGRITGKACR